MRYTRKRDRESYYMHHVAFLLEHIRPPYNSACTAHCAIVRYESVRTGLSKSDRIIASETNGPRCIVRRPIAGARVAERRFISKDRKSLSAN